MPFYLPITSEKDNVVAKNILEINWGLKNANKTKRNNDWNSVLDLGKLLRSLINVILRKSPPFPKDLPTTYLA